MTDVRESGESSLVGYGESGLVGYGESGLVSYGETGLVGKGTVIRIRKFPVKTLLGAWPGFRDPTLLQGSWWPLDQICKKGSD